MAGRIPENILRLHVGEESLRAKALALIEADARLALHLDITVHVMDLFDILRQFPTEDEDLKVIQVLGIRTFKAFASGRQQSFAAGRGWKFPMVSNQGTTFAEDMGYRPNGRTMPGVSVFKRKGDKIMRVADTGFRPGDDFCGVWHLFDLIPEGAAGWQPRFSYPS